MTHSTCEQYVSRSNESSFYSYINFFLLAIYQVLCVSRVLNKCLSSFILLIFLSFVTWDAFYSLSLSLCDKVFLLFFFCISIQSTWRFYVAKNCKLNYCLSAIGDCQSFETWFDYVKHKYTLERLSHLVESVVVCDRLSFEWNSDEMTRHVKGFLRYCSNFDWIFFYRLVIRQF